MSRQLTVAVPGRPFSLNAERSKHWSDRARRVAQFRLDAKFATLEALGSRRPRFERVSVDVYPYALNRRYRQDVGNCYASMKAALDGVVDTGILADDDDSHVVAVTFHPHQFGVDQLVLVLTESEGGEAGAQ